MVFRNAEDTRGALEQGREAEARFERVASKLGWIVTKVDPETDMKQHMDFVIAWGDPKNVAGETATYSVDVKSRNTAENGEETWIEIRNIAGGPGWLYGKADMIAFEQEDRFILVERDKLRQWIEDNVEKDYVTLAHQALMKVYTRQGREDMITLVKTYHLKGLATGEMKDG